MRRDAGLAGVRAHGRRTRFRGCFAYALQGTFDAIWSGRECKGCKVRGLCPAPIDALVAPAPEPTSPLPPRARSRTRRA